MTSFYPTMLDVEVREQPQALQRLLRASAAAAADVCSLLAREDIRYVLIASRGSSSNAARYAQYLLGRARRVPVAFATPSLFTVYEQPPRLDGALVIGISQSGASPDVVSVLAEARRQGRPTVALTNNTASALAGEADVVLDLHAGDEQAVAATKTYVNSLGAIALIFATLDGSRRSRDELARMPDRLEEQIALSERALPPMDAFADTVGATVVSRGINYGTAFEVALKIRELSGLVVEAYSPADLLHGPIAAIRPGWPVIVLSPSGPAHESIAEIEAPLRARGARLVVVSDAAGGWSDASFLPLVDGVPEWLSPFTAVVPGQLLARGLAATRGLDLDRPRGLEKITLTR